MSLSILNVKMRYEHDVVSARQRARQIARLVGFDPQDQSRIATAVSEIARNAFRYGGGGTIEYTVEGRTAPQILTVCVTDQGPGISDLPSILEGRYRSSTGMGLGIVGARRLMDQFHIESTPGSGTAVVLKKVFPRRASVIDSARLASIQTALASERPSDPFSELQLQNQELLKALDELRKRQEELAALNSELEDTNRGVVALYAELDEKAGHLRRADELKSKFLSNMSHEFRSPLNSILALSSLLLARTDGPLTSEQQQQVDFIRKAAQDLFELVNDLLDLAKVEAGKVEVRPAEFEVSNLFGALRGMLRPLLLNQSVNLIFDSPDDLPTLYTDEAKVSQILRNFISNALKFTEDGEIRVTARLNTAQNAIIFAVTDTGIGIAPEDHDRIFQDFSQVDNPIQRRVKGTGLGLPLTKKLTELLGGSVGVASRLGAGSTFTAEIPVRYACAEQDQPQPTPALAGDPSAAIVLVVEDKPEELLVYERYLRDSEFRIVSAQTIREARQQIAAVRPAVIVLDIVLRGEDSWSFLATLKNDPLTRAIPVIVATSVEDQNKGYHLGADLYAMKPVDRESLLAQLRKLTSQAPVTRVLIIDDSERDRYVLKQILRGPTVQITEAAGGDDGLFRARHERPDVIFLDLVMPGTTGLDVLERLKSDPSTNSIPVVVCTSKVLDERERRVLAERAAATIMKGDLAREETGIVLNRIIDRAATNIALAVTRRG